MKVLKMFIDTSVISAYNDTRNIERMKMTRRFWDDSTVHLKYISGLVQKEIMQIADNERKIKDAWSAETIPVLEYSEDCVLSRKK